MDDLIPALRMLERIVVVGFGGLSIYLGYKLFFHLPSNTDHKGQIELPGVKLVLSRVGPGIFFCAFGSIILFQSIYKDVHVKSTQRVSEPVENVSTVEQEDSAYIDEFTGAAPSLTSKFGNVGEQAFLHIEKVKKYALKLNCARDKLDPEINDMELQNTFDIALLGIYRLGWNTSEYGEFEGLTSSTFQDRFRSDIIYNTQECL